jgi:glycosyltransferase A (GT-A) superfamily protein (DUF2064 family)
MNWPCSPEKVRQPVGHFRRAFVMLTKPEIDVVLGPCEDGGHYLIGVREIHRKLFDDRASGSPRDNTAC